VVAATGEADGPAVKELAGALGVEAAKDGLKADRDTFAASAAGVYAAGGAARKTGRMAVRALADGRTAAFSVTQFLAGRPVAGSPRQTSCHVGKLRDEEMAMFMGHASPSPRVEPRGGRPSGFSRDEAKAEAARCLRCDCRKADTCRLREHSDALGASTRRYRAERRTFEERSDHPDVVYEPGKCIDCGSCGKITAEAGERFGFAFIGRGFRVRVGAPLGKALSDALRRTAGRVVASCPTGALAFRDDREATTEDTENTGEV
jgi:ferredoxin